MKLNKNIIMLSLILVLLSVLLLPYSFSDGLRYRFGYPLAFFTTYDLPFNTNELLISKISINQINLLIDIIVIYIFITAVVYILQKLKMLIKY